MEQPMTPLIGCSSGESNGKVIPPIETSDPDVSFKTTPTEPTEPPPGEIQTGSIKKKRVRFVSSNNQVRVFEKDKVEYQIGIRTRRQLKDQELEVKYGIETEDVDDEDDRLYDDVNLVGTQIRGLYEGSGWHTGTIEYYNSELDKYLVLFEDESEDLIKVEDIDGVDMKFMDKPKSSQRIHKDVHLIGSQIRADYEGSGWHRGTIKYYNSELDKYCIVFEDESEDMITEEDIDGVDMCFLTKSEMSEKNEIKPETSQTDQVKEETIFDKDLMSTWLAVKDKAVSPILKNGIVKVKKDTTDLSAKKDTIPVKVKEERSDIGVKKDTVPVIYSNENQVQMTDFKTLFKTAKKPKVEKKQKNEDKPKVEKKLKTDKKLKKEKDNILNDMVQSMNSGGSNKVCQHCGVSFINQAILDTHILIVHGDIQSQIKQEAEDLLSTIKSESIVKNLYKSKNGDIQSQIKQEAEDLLSTIKSEMVKVKEGPTDLVLTNDMNPLKRGHQVQITDNFKTAKKAKVEKKPKAEKKPKVEKKPKIPKEKKPKKEVKRKMNRFPIPEEEIAKRGLPDYLKEGLDMVFIGINPSMAAAYSGKYYDGGGNHFWPALYLSKLIPEPMNPQDDYKLMDMGIGFTNIVPRTTRGIADLSKQEIADGAKVLLEKLNKYRPKIAVFNGKQIYQVYSNQKKFLFGRQPQPLFGGSTWVWVMPSSSARCAQLPRACDKVPFYSALGKFRDHLTGKLDKIDECEITFASVVLTNWPRKNSVKKEESKSGPSEPGLMQGGQLLPLPPQILAKLEAKPSPSKGLGLLLSHPDFRQSLPLSKSGPSEPGMQGRQLLPLPPQILAGIEAKNNPSKDLEVSLAPPNFRQSLPLPPKILTGIEVKPSP